MIQPLFNGMMAILLAKFMLNDVPHAAGLTVNPRARKEAPRPTFFTHSTNEEAYKLILQSGQIIPKHSGDYVPVSLDGGLESPWGGYVFTFPLKVLLDKEVKPVFYLGTSDFIGTAEGPNFIIMDMTAIFATEVTVFEPLSITQAKISKGAIPLTPLTSFIRPVIEELKRHARAILAGPRISGYSRSTLSIIDSYNQVLASVFGIDYVAVKDFAEGVVRNDLEWEVWWK